MMSELEGEREHRNHQSVFYLLNLILTEGFRKRMAINICSGMKRLAANEQRIERSKCLNGLLKLRTSSP
jgi:hypothetical protein